MSQDNIEVAVIRWFELAAVLEALATDAATEEERTNFQRAADTVRHAGPELLRSLAAGALGGLARSQLGI